MLWTFGDDLADSIHAIHTLTVTLKTAAFLALIGMLLLTILVSVDFILTLSGMLRDIVPAISLLTSLVHLLASVSVTVFFYTYYRAQA